VVVEDRSSEQQLVVDGYWGAPDRCQSAALVRCCYLPLLLRVWSDLCWVVAIGFALISQSSVAQLQLLPKVDFLCVFFAVDRLILISQSLERSG
jgi:hypothetical protein